jgi:hypothetical protein
MADLSSRAQLRIWIARERRGHADEKYDHQAHLDRIESLMADDGALCDDGWWMRFIPRYFERARMFKLSTPQGRQAMGKYIVTLCHCLEYAIELYGDMPEPGHTSGEIRPWRSLPDEGRTNR